MEIYVAADHNGFEMKNQLVRWLVEQGYHVVDMGPTEFNKADDYPDFGIPVANAVAEDTKNRRGVLLCASGVGMAVVASKATGVRASLIHDPAIAAAAQRDDNINIVAIGAAYIDLPTAKKVITNWLTTPFSGEERHVRRINKITTYEKLQRINNE